MSQQDQSSKVICDKLRSLVAGLSLTAKEAGVISDAIGLIGYQGRHINGLRDQVAKMAAREDGARSDISRLENEVAQVKGRGRLAVIELETTFQDVLKQVKARLDVWDTQDRRVSNHGWWRRSSDAGGAVQKPERVRGGE